MLDGTAQRIVLSAAVVGLFYWALFTGRAPERSSPVAPAPASSRGMAAEEAKRLASVSRALIRDGNHAAALAPIRALHDAFPSSHIYIDQLATVYHHLTRFDDEAALLEEYLLKAPTPDSACPRLGLAYRAQGREDKALDAFERCLALDSDDPDAIFYLAHAEERAGRVDKAAEFYRRGLVWAPGYSDMSLGLARIDLRAGRVRQAKAAALDVLKKSPDNTDALLLAGLACLRNGEPSEARKHLERGLRLSPDNAELSRALAQAEAGEHR